MTPPREAVRRAAPRVRVVLDVRACEACGDWHARRDALCAGCDAEVDEYAAARALEAAFPWDDAAEVATCA